MGKMFPTFTKKTLNGSSALAIVISRFNGSGRRLVGVPPWARRLGAQGILPAPRVHYRVGKSQQAADGSRLRQHQGCRG